MTQPHSTQELLAELAALRTRLAEAEDTLAAIRQGRVDAVVVDGPQGEQIFTLQGADQPYRVMIESMQEGAVTLTADGTILFSNQSFARLVQTPLEQILGSNLRQFIATVDQEQFAVVLEHGLAVSSASELLFLTSDGTQVSVALSLTSLHTYDVPAVCVVMTDLTDQKRHAELVVVQRALRRSEGELADFFDNAAVGLHWVGPDGIIQRVNQAELDLLGYTAEEYLGHSIAEFHADQAVIADILDRLTCGETLQDYEAQLRCKDGSLKTVLINSNVLWEEGRFIHTRCFTRDITEHKRLEEDIARQTAELQQFSYIVSHDLNEPLRTMNSFATLLARRYQGKLDAPAEEYLAFVMDGAQRMQQMITDLLDYTRADGQTETFTPVDGEALLARVCTDLQLAVAEAKAEVSHDPLPTVLGDATRLGQVLQNLIGNALKFRGPAPPRIHVSAQREGQHWRFSIRDNGIGIDPKHAGRLFQVFQRLHTRSEYPGTGIGLAICKKIIERHSGRIWVESSPGQGAIFYFTISDKKRNDE